MLDISKENTSFFPCHPSRLQVQGPRGHSMGMCFELDDWKERGERVWAYMRHWLARGGWVGWVGWVWAIRILQNVVRSANLRWPTCPSFPGAFSILTLKLIYPKQTRMVGHPTKSSKHSFECLLCASMSLKEAHGLVSQSFILSSSAFFFLLFT